jgi:hypothetical protein
MQDEGLYSVDIPAIKERVKKAGLTDYFSKIIV